MKFKNMYSFKSHRKIGCIARLKSKTCVLILILTMGVGEGLCQSMEWVSRPGEYDTIEYAGHDVFRVRNPKGKWGLMQSDGKLILEAVYDSITPFIENRALLLDRPSQRLLGIIDTKGTFVKDFSGDEVYVSRFPQYKEGRLAFSRGGGKYGYMNENGGVAIEPRFYLAAPFQDGTAAVQYDNTEYGLIRKDGRSAIISDDRYYFMSTPVDRKVLVIKGSRKGGDQLVLMRIDGTSLKKEKVLEDGMNITLSDDFTELTCQLGHSYFIDDQWRVTSASHPAPLPQIWEESSAQITEDTSILRGKPSSDGIKISYKDIPIVNQSFKKVSTYDKNYAIVQSKEGKQGILKLNPSADIKVSATDAPVIFQHNEAKEVDFNVSLKNLNPNKLKIKKIEGDSSKECELLQMDGEWKLQVPYFMEAEKYDEEVTGIVSLIFEYDDLEWRTLVTEIKSMHQPGYTVTLTGNGTTNEAGNSVLSLNVKALNSKNASGSVTINGGKPITFTNGSKVIPLNVSVPEGTTKTFTYHVKVKEEGCPEYSATVSKSVNNPARKETEPKESGKKKIIIQ